MAFGFIKRLFGGNTPEAVPAPATISPIAHSAALQNTLPPAPGAAGTIAGLPTETMLHREIVVSRELQVSGYDFRLRESVLKRKERAPHMVWKLYDEVLLRNFVAEEARKPFGQKLIFLQISMWSLESPLFQQLPPARFVLMLHPHPELVDRVGEFVPLLTQLKALGFAIGFDDLPLAAEWAQLGALADFLRFSIVDREIGELTETFTVLGAQAPAAQLIVSGIRFFEELQAVRQLPVSYLEGGYLRHREPLPEADVDAGYMRLLETLNLVRAEADAAAIAHSMKYDPLLSFKLLRFVNSPASGLVSKIDSVERAVIVLGHQQLYRWLSLLLFSHERQDGTQTVLMEMALIRARMMETLGKKHFKREHWDALFTIGMFSMLDVLLSRPMAQIIDKLALSEDICKALIERDGRFGPLLKLVLACEEGDLPDDQTLFDAAHVGRSETNRAQIEAMLWVEEVT